MVELSGGRKVGTGSSAMLLNRCLVMRLFDGNIANLDVVGDSIKRALRRFGSGIKNVAVAVSPQHRLQKLFFQQGCGIRNGASG